MDRRQIFSDIHDRIPRNRALVALEPGFEIDANVAARLHALHRGRGTRLVLNGYHRRDPREELLELVDAVEIDSAPGQGDAELLIRRAQRRHLQVFARGVDSDADFLSARTAGFDLFAGDHFAQPGENPETQASVDGRVLLELLLEAQASLDVSAVSDRMAANPLLSEGLLRLVNSLELARAQKIESVSQALIMIGAKGLARWLNLLLFQVGGPNGNVGPLFRVAASRARLMEIVATQGSTANPEEKDRGDAAFLVGILSLVPVLLGESRTKAIGSLPIAPETREAILEYKGELGSVLRLVECLDAGAFAEAAERAKELGLEPHVLWAHQRAAYEWVSQML